MGSELESRRGRESFPRDDQSGFIQAITFRLVDSVPREVIDFWKIELNWRADLPSSHRAHEELRRRLARYEDQCHGECWLRRPEIARLVQDALLLFQGEGHELIAWCVMPNHVHAMIEFREGVPSENALKTWKFHTANEANQLLERSGAFWMEDSHDLIIRDENHLSRTIASIEENPVKAGLVLRKEDWPWSSVFQSPE